MSFSLAPSKIGVAIFQPSVLGRVAQMDLQNLPDVHTGRDAQGVQHNIQRRAIRQERHILLRQDAGDDALVTVTAGHLIADGDLPLLGDIDTGRPC